VIADIEAAARRDDDVRLATAAEVVIVDEEPGRLRRTDCTRRR
jgi:hypothetical protein